MGTDFKQSWAKLSQGAAAAFVFGAMFAAGAACINSPGTVSVSLINPVSAATTSSTVTIGNINLSAPSGGRTMVFETTAISFNPSSDVILLGVELTCDSFTLSGDTYSMCHWGVKYAGPDTPVPMNLEGAISGYAGTTTSQNVFGESGSGVFLSDSRAFDLAWQGLSWSYPPNYVVTGSNYTQSLRDTGFGSRLYLPYATRFCATVLPSFTIRANSAPKIYFTVQLAVMSSNPSLPVRLGMTNAKLVLRFLDVS